MPASTTGKPRQIFAFSGIVAADGEKSSFVLIEHAISLAATTGPAKICYIPTAIGDAPDAVKHYTEKFTDRPEEFSALTLFAQPSVPDIRSHLLAQDVIFVEGGSVANLMAVWRVHGLPEIMRECWEAGVVLSGASAGSLCWHQGGPTDSFRDALDPFTDGIALLPYSNGVHDDFPDQPRRETYRRFVGSGIHGPGYASEDGTGLHYIGTDLHEAVSIRDGKRAWWVEPGPGGSYHEREIVPRLI